MLPSLRRAREVACYEIRMVFGVVVFLVLCSGCRRVLGVVVFGVLSCSGCCRALGLCAHSLGIASLILHLRRFLAERLIP